MELNNINVGKRVGTMLLDHMVMSAIFMLSFLPLFIARFSDSFKVDYEDSGNSILELLSYFIMLLGLTLYFIKDSFGGRSIAKRILKLQVVDNSTGKAADPLKCFVRNIFIILWPIEVVIAMTNTNRRLGDRVAGTKLVVFDPTLEQEKIKAGKVLLAFVLAYCLTLLIFLPLKLKEILISNQVPFIESSYNQIESHETEILLNDSLTEYLTAKVKVYDKIESTNLKYVSIIVQLKADYLKEDNSFRLLSNKTTSLLFSKYAENSFVGKLKYVYQIHGHSQVRIQTFDGRDMGE